MSAAPKPWISGDPEQELEARTKLRVWPLDEYNALLLNEVHPQGYEKSNEPHEVYDLIGTWTFLFPWCCDCFTTTN